MGVSQIRYLFGDPHIKDCRILGSTWVYIRVPLGRRTNFASSLVWFARSGLTILHADSLFMTYENRKDNILPQRVSA